MYNLSSFGKLLKKSRLKLNLSLENLSQISGVSKKTIIDLEKGIHCPSLQIVFLLSSALKVDLLEILSKSKYMSNNCNIDEIIDIKLSIEHKFDNNQFNRLQEEIDLLDDLYNKTDDIFFSTYIYQLILFIDGVQLAKVNKNFDLAFQNFIEAIKLTIVDFNINNYNLLFYSDFELRILMSISLVLNNKKEFQLSEDMLNFIIEYSKQDSNIQLLALYNLAIFKSRMGQNEKALKIIKYVINTTIMKRNVSRLHLHYYEKAIFEYKLKDNNYTTSFNLSKSLAEANNLIDFLKFLNGKMKKYGIETSIES